jgi:hypothetical protein
MWKWILAATTAVACESSAPSSSGQPPGEQPVSLPLASPVIGAVQTRCTVDADCRLWSADYTLAGCCPTRCAGKSGGAVAINHAMFFTVEGACYQNVVKACDRRDEKYQCGESPRSAACVEGSCVVRERGGAQPADEQRGP